MTALGIDYNWVPVRVQFQDGEWRDTKTQEVFGFYPPAEKYIFGVEERQKVYLTLYRCPISVNCPTGLKWANMDANFLPDTICQKLPSGQFQSFVEIQLITVLSRL